MGQGVLDIDNLLAPLETGEGGGEDLRPDYSPQSLYQRIRTQRNDARAGERAIDGGDPDANPAAVQSAWRDVKKLGIECLSGKAKDFEIAAWMTEALVRLDGLRGLADGAAVIAGLSEQYWDTGFPRLDDEDGIDGRGAPIGGLSGEGADGTLMAAIRSFPLFRRGDGSDCDLFTWQRAEETAALTDQARRESRYAAGVPVFDSLQSEARVDTATLRATGDIARAAAAAWAAMDAAISARFGADTPSTRRVAEALAAIIEISTRVAGGGASADAGTAPEEDAGVAAPAGAAAPAAGGGAGVPGGPRVLRTREDAIQAIEEVAAFFRKTEPHSPLAFTLDDAARRARMPLPELLAEVLPDPSVRRMMLASLGIRVPEE
jgi:type VI secretion system protein ImpA